METIYRKVAINIPENVKNGDVVQHKDMVELIKIYAPIYDQVTGNQIGITPVMIHRFEFNSIAEQIEEIESRVYNSAYENLPF